LLFFSLCQSRIISSRSPLSSRRFTGSTSPTAPSPPNSNRKNRGLCGFAKGDRLLSRGECVVRDYGQPSAHKDAWLDLSYQAHSLVSAIPVP
jgi:hypothetical protein